MTYEARQKILSNFSSYLSGLEDNFFTEFRALDTKNTKELQAFIESLSYNNGIIDSSQNYLDQLLKLRKALFDNYKDPAVQAIIEEYINKLPEIVYQHKVSASKINGLLSGDINNGGLVDYYTDVLKTNFSLDVYAKDMIQPMVNNYQLLLSRSTNLSTLRGDLEAQGGRVQQYSKQLVLDANRQIIGESNHIIKEQYGLDGFIYEGGLVKNSRNLCVLFVELKRPIGLLEIDMFLKDSDNEDGLINGTNKGNFIQRVGGYGCRHHATPVRLSNEDKKEINKYWSREVYKIAG